VTDIRNAAEKAEYSVGTLYSAMRAIKWKSSPSNAGNGVLECAAGAAVELGGERMAVGPGGAVLIPPGVRHRAARRMTILDVVVPGHFGA
jgi:hypothetical protein